MYEHNLFIHVWKHNLFIRVWIFTYSYTTYSYMYEFSLNLFIHAWIFTNKHDWFIHAWIFTYSYMWSFSFIHVTWLIRTCAMTHSHMGHNSPDTGISPRYNAEWGVRSELSKRTTIVEKNHNCRKEPQLCDLTHAYLWHDSFIRVSWLIRTGVMTHSHMWHNSHVWHDSLTHVTWLTHVIWLTYVTWLTRHRNLSLIQSRMMSWLGIVESKHDRSVASFRGNSHGDTCTIRSSRGQHCWRGWCTKQYIYSYIYIYIIYIYIYIYVYI